MVPAVGKTIPADAISIDKIKKMPQVAVATECVEDMALAVYRDKQLMVRVKGVQDNFPELTNIQKILYGEGSFETHAGILQYGIFGVRAAQSLGFGTRWEGFLHIYAPIKEGQVDPSNPTTAFVVDSLLSPDVIFIANQQKYDKDHVVTSIDFARNLFWRARYDSSLEIKAQTRSRCRCSEERNANIGGKS